MSNRDVSQESRVKRCIVSFCGMLIYKTAVRQCLFMSLVKSGGFN